MSCTIMYCIRCQGNAGRSRADAQLSPAELGMPVQIYISIFLVRARKPAYWPSSRRTRLPRFPRFPWSFRRLSHHGSHVLSRRCLGLRRPDDCVHDGCVIGRDGADAASKGDGRLGELDPSRYLHGQENRNSQGEQGGSTPSIASTTRSSSAATRSSSAATRSSSAATVI